MLLNDNSFILKLFFRSRKYILAGIFLVFLATDLYLCWKYFYQFTFYDSSPELVLGELLSEENSLITSSWYYSTEIRIFYTQIVNRFLFEIISDYRIVNTVSIFVHLILLEGSLYYFIRCLLNKKNSTWFWIIAVWFLVPYNSLWRSYILFGLFYIPHFIIILLSLGMYFHFVRIFTSTRINRLNKITKIFILVILELFLALLAGMGGIRHLEILYLPFFSSFFLLAFFQRERWNYWKPSLFLSAAMLVACGIGYIINLKILANSYHFDNYQDVLIVNFMWSRLEELIHNLNINFGFVGSTLLLSLRGLASISSFIIWILIFLVIPLIVKKFKAFSIIEQVFLIFSALQWILNWFILEYTDTYCSPRYFLPQLLSLIIVFVLFFRQCWLLKNKFLVSEIRQCLSVLIIFFLIIQTINGYIYWPNEEKNSYELREIVSILKEENYRFGYGDFFKTGAIPALSDGKIDMVYISDFTEFSIDPWLMKIESGKVHSGEDKTFVLVTSETYNEIIDMDYIRQGHELWSSNNYVLLGYNSLNDLWNAITNEVENNE